MDLKEIKNIKDPEVIKRFKAIKISFDVNVQKASEEFQITTRTIFKWRKLYETEGVNGLFSKSKAHKIHPLKVTDSEKAEIIIFVKSHPDLSYEKIANELDKFGIKRHWMTIYDICKKDGIKKVYPKTTKTKIKKEEKIQITENKIKDYEWRRIRNSIDDTYNERPWVYEAIENHNDKIEKLFSDSLTNSHLLNDLYNHSVNKKLIKLDVICFIDEYLKEKEKEIQEKKKNTSQLLIKKNIK